MHEQRNSRTDRDVLAWLDGGPEPARPEVLAAALGRTRSLGQRPAGLARLLGAPDGGAGSGSHRHRAMLALTGLLLTLAAVLVITGLFAVAGGPPRPTFTALSLVPSFSAAPAESEPPAATPGPSGVLSPSPRMVDFTVDDLGFAASTAPQPQPEWTDEWARLPGLRGETYTVFVGVADRGALVGSGRGTAVRIFAERPDDVVEQLRAIPGRSVEGVEETTVDGEPARLVWTKVGREPSYAMVATVHAARLYLIALKPAHPRAGSRENDIVVLRDYLRSFRFIDPVVHRRDGFVVTYPDSWPASLKGGSLKLGGRGLFAPYLTVVSRPVGTPIPVARGDGVPTLLLEGTTLDQLRTSSRLLDARDVSVDGIPGFRFDTAQDAMLRPLVAMAVFVVNDRVVVATMHLGIEGPTNRRAFDRLLEGLLFE